VGATFHAYHAVQSRRPLHKLSLDQRRSSRPSPVVSGVHTFLCQITRLAFVSGLGRRRGPATARASVIIGFNASSISRSRHANLASSGVNVFTINEAMKLRAEEGLIRQATG
jgi:hypothetical protein